MSDVVFVVRCEHEKGKWTDSIWDTLAGAEERSQEILHNGIETVTFDVYIDEHTLNERP